MVIMSATARRVHIAAILISLCLPVRSRAQEAQLQKLSAQATDLYRQGKCTEAVKMQQDALKLAEKTFGSTNRAVATALSNLAEYQRCRGDYHDAENHLKRALAIDQKALGPDHPDVAVDLNNLGMLYDSLGRHADAEPLYNQAIPIDEK